MIRRTIAAAFAAALSAAPAHAQHSYAAPGATFDARVPTPAQILGYELGSRFTSHRAMMRYVERIAAASKRVKVDTVARSFEGREMLVIAVTSEANQTRLADIQKDAQRIADPRGASAAEIDAAIKRLPSVVWLAHSVHGGEASGVEAGLALLYQLAAGTDPHTRLALDSTVVLIDPNQNPDGRERHVHDYEKYWSPRGLSDNPGAMNNAGTWPGPRTSHYYFDLNRDWYAQSHPETRGRARTFLAWMPHVAVDLHEQGSSASFYFAPPREPDNQNNPKHLPKWFDIFAAAHGAAFDTHGWSYFRREGYDSFYPGYGEGWPMLTGSVGMLFESASSSGGAVRRSDGTIRTLHQAAWEHYTAEWNTVLTSARRRTELLRDYTAARANAIAVHAKGPLRGVVFTRDAQGRADSLAARLRDNGIEVKTLTADVTMPASSFMRGAVAAAKFPAQSYVVDFSQPQGHLAKALLEPNADLDSAFVKFELELRRTGQRNRFYDITGWSLPYAYRVDAYTVSSMPAALASYTPSASSVAAPARAQYAYAFAPGTEASTRLLAQLLTDSIKVWYAPYGFTSRGQAFPNGAFVVRVQPNRADVHDAVSRHALAAGVPVASITSAGVDQGTDLGSNSVVPIPRPRIALLGGTPVSGNPFGFAWYALDQRIGYASSIIDANYIAGSDLNAFTTIIMPSVQAGALDRVLGDAGRQRLVDWVRNGGVLVTLEGASAWVAQERVGLVRTRVKRDSARADSTGGAPLPGGLAGVIARATVDSLSPITAGILSREIPVFANGGTVFTIPRDLSAGEALIRFAPAERVKLSGYYWPESAAKIAGSPYLWTERAGRGRVILFAQDPVYRDQQRGTLQIFANAVLLGGTY
jgi:hypothetical protein